MTNKRHRSKVEILYNPYQGLKLLMFLPVFTLSLVEILYNPYQGLKPDYGDRGVGCPRSKSSIIPIRD